VEDERRSEEMDEFEEKLNFRFQEKGGVKIKTFERDIDDTMREKDKKRTEKRKERLKRKEDLKLEVKKLAGVGFG
jgi:protein KRI1